MSNKEIVVQAGMTECNHGGIEVAMSPDGSLVYWRKNYGEDNITEWKEADIHYSDINNDGEPFEKDEEGYPDFQPYFVIGNVDENGKEWMYFLSEFMRYDR